MKLCKGLANASWFQNSILLVIVFNAALLGFETSPQFLATYGSYAKSTHLVIQVIFCIELAIRLLAFWPSLGKFFKDGWNVFDFVVVVLSLLPASGPFATVARLARILRILRIVTISPDLRLIVGTMLRSIPSMGHVILLLLILLYIYAIIGNHFFAGLQPQYWGTLGNCFLTLFQVLTLEGWVDIQNELLPTYPWAWVYFISFVVVTVFVVINLFIAIVTNNLQSVKQEEPLPSSGGDVRAQIAALRAALDTLERSISK